MTPDQIGHWTGILAGAAIVGALFGLIPQILAQRQNRMSAGWIGFSGTLLGGLILGVLLAAPISIIFGIYIFFTKKNPPDPSG